MTQQGLCLPRQAASSRGARACAGVHLPTSAPIHPILPPFTYPHRPTRPNSPGKPGSATSERRAGAIPAKPLSPASTVDLPRQMAATTRPEWIATLEVRAAKHLASDAQRVSARAQPRTPSHRSQSSGVGNPRPARQAPVPPRRTPIHSTPPSHPTSPGPMRLSSPPTQCHPGCLGDRQARGSPSALCSTRPSRR